MSHFSTINLVDSFGEDFDKRVMEWKEVAGKKMMMIEVKLRIF